MRASWRTGDAESPLRDVMSADQLDRLDLFDRIQLEGVVRVCQTSATLAEAGRKLFAVSRQNRATANDSDRLRKYLQRFGLEFDRLRCCGPCRDLRHMDPG